MIVCDNSETFFSQLGREFPKVFFTARKTMNQLNRGNRLANW
jgi:hypothetical protein